MPFSLSLRRSRWKWEISEVDFWSSIRYHKLTAIWFDRRPEIKETVTTTKVNREWNKCELVKANPNHFMYWLHFVLVVPTADSRPNQEYLILLTDTIIDTLHTYSPFASEPNNAWHLYYTIVRNIWKWSYSSWNMMLLTHPSFKFIICAFMMKLCKFIRNRKTTICISPFHTLTLPLPHCAFVELMKWKTIREQKAQSAECDSVFVRLLNSIQIFDVPPSSFWHYIFNSAACCAGSLTLRPKPTNKEDETKERKNGAEKKSQTKSNKNNHMNSE